LHSFVKHEKIAAAADFDVANQFETEARFPFKRIACVALTKTARNASACVGKQPIMVATALTEHFYWLALAFVA